MALAGLDRESLATGSYPSDEALAAYVKTLRLRQRSYRTEQSYCEWVRRCVRYHGLEKAADLLPEHLAPFIQHLVVERGVAPSTQRQALCALVDFCKEGLGHTEVSVGAFAHSTRPRQVPTVMGQAEVRALMDALSADPEVSLLCWLLYGSGLRLMEALRLRLLDVDLAHRQLSVRT
jgi:site-specific recombinase XerD